MKAPNIVYHITHKHNIESILFDNKLKSSYGCIYTCPTYTDALNFIIHSTNWSIENCAILKLYLSSKPINNILIKFRNINQCIAIISKFS